MKKKSRRKRDRKWYLKRKNLPPYCFGQYKGHSKKRNYEFELTYEDFLIYLHQPCHYCGDEIKTVGLDRVDNNIGYRKDNIVTCCTTCNYMKKMTGKDEFLAHCRKIVSKHP